MGPQGKMTGIAVCSLMVPVSGGWSIGRRPADSQPCCAQRYGPCEYLAQVRGP